MAQRMQLSWRQYQRLEAGASPLLRSHLEALEALIAEDGWALPQSLGSLGDYLRRLVDPRNRMTAEGWQSKFRLFRPRELRAEVQGHSSAWEVTTDEAEGVHRLRAAGQNRLTGPMGSSDQGVFWRVLGGPETVSLRGPGGMVVALEAEGEVALLVPPGWEIGVGPCASLEGLLAGTRTVTVVDGPQDLPPDPEDPFGVAGLQVVRTIRYTG